MGAETGKICLPRTEKGGFDHQGGITSHLGKRCCVGEERGGAAKWWHDRRDRSGTMERAPRQPVTHWPRKTRRRLPPGYGGGAGGARGEKADALSDRRQTSDSQISVSDARARYLVEPDPPQLQPWAQRGPSNAPTVASTILCCYMGLESQPHPWKASSRGR